MTIPAPLNNRHSPISAASLNAIDTISPVDVNAPPTAAPSHHRDKHGNILPHRATLAKLTRNNATLVHALGGVP
jgi:hypothetical protein